MDTNDLIFDENWDIKGDSLDVEKFWKDSPLTESVPLLKSIVLNNYKVIFVRNTSGLLVVQLPEFNIELNVLSPSGLNSRRGEPYTIGDILLFTTVRREDYTYSSVTKRGFKYINVLERDRLKSILEESKIAPELLDFRVQYCAIDPQSEIKIPGKSLYGPSKTPTTKLSVKKIVESVYNELKILSKPYEEACKIIDESKLEPNQLRILKKAKHDYLTTLVFATCIQERPIRTRNSLLTSHGEGFEKILLKADTSENVKKSKGQEPGPLGSLMGTQTKMKVIDEICYKYRKRPIIIVPSGTGSIIARQNIKQMLQDHQFVDAHESLRNNGPLPSSLPMNAVEILHTVGKKQVKFRVVENSYISRFTTNDWVLRISRSHRHNDASVAKEFWQYIENFLMQPRQRKISQNKMLS